MKIDPFADGIFSKSTADALSQLFNCPYASFQEQVEAAGLNPGWDFRHADLSEVDFSYSNLAGFDFTDSNLRGATGILVTWDKTTVFPTSELDGSIFALPVALERRISDDRRAQDWLTRVGRLGTTEKILWSADQLRAGAPHSDVALPVAQDLFWKSDDPFLQSQLLFFLAPRMSDDQIREMLIASLSHNAASGALVRNALDIAIRRRMIGDRDIRTMTRSLLQSKDTAVRERSLKVLSRHRPSVDDVSAIYRAIGQHPNLGATYVLETARALGEQYLVVVRHPVTREILHPGQAVAPVDLYLMARRWLKLEANVLEERRGIRLSERGPSSESFKEAQVRERMREVIKLHAHLKRWGINFRYDETLPDQPIPNLPQEPKRGD